MIKARAMLIGIILILLSQSPVLAADERLAADEDRNYFIFKHRLKDGSVRDVEVYTSPVANVSGDNLLLSIVHDITPRMEAEEAAARNSNIAYALMLLVMFLLALTILIVNRSRLRDNRAREKIEMERSLLETVLDDAALGYWDWDLKNDREYHSHSDIEMLGYKTDEISDRPQDWQGLMFAQDLRIALGKFSEHVKSQGQIPFYNEARYHHKDGSTVWVITSGRVVEWDDDGKPLRMVGCHYDITRIKALEEEIIDERALLKTILHSITDGVMAVDSDGKIRFINPIAEKLIGCPNKMAKGRDFTELYKLTNDAFGHHTGDQLLMTVARLLQAGCRPKDITARIGGDEFLLILPQTSYDQAQPVIDTIEDLIGQTNMDNVILSVSFGRQTKADPKQLMEEVFSQAEDAMYRQKMTQGQIMRVKTIPDKGRAAVIFKK